MKTTHDTRRSTLGGRGPLLPSSPRPPSGREKAFTLIEMLIVISIISTLLALLYGAIERAQKFSRRTITYTELKSVESAFKQYYAHYHAWPSNNVAGISFRLSSETGEDLGFVIDAPLARMLQGVHRDNDPEVWELNYESIPFLEFSRYSPVTLMPVNPFRSDSTAVDDTTRSYHVLFDTNGDQQIRVPAGNYPNPTNVTVVATVAVWTVIPATRKVSNNGQAENAAEVIFGSWESFNVK